MGDCGERQAIIRTVRGHGFRFVAAIEPVAPRIESPSRIEATPLRVVSRLTPLADLQDPPALPSMPSIALLGFESLGMGAAPDVFVEGLAVDLNARLSRLQGLFGSAASLTMAPAGVRGTTVTVRLPLRQRRGAHAA